MPQLVPASHEALWTPGKEVTAETRVMHATTIALMQRAVAEVGAAGIAAPQIGLSLRMFVTKYPGWEVCINPHFKPVGDQFISKPEKCLSRLDFSTYVRRPAVIRAMFEDGDGKAVNLTLEGMDARVFMHLTELTEGRPIFPRPKAAVMQP